tara:strand:+ start:1162 stop:1734 length:573 start_codon:yes stop_codon:yes gene_type:complete
MKESNDNLTAEFFEQDVDWKNATTDDEMKGVSDLAQKQVEAKNKVDQLTEELSLAKEELRDIQERQLPEKMAEVGFSEIKLNNGVKIVIQDFYNAHISKANSEQAFAWLEDNGFGDIIKHEVGVKFGKDQSIDAVSAYDQLRAMGFTPYNNKGVHSSTLKAWVKEQIESGNGNIPTDIFGLFIGSRAKIS